MYSQNGGVFFVSHGKYIFVNVLLFDSLMLSVRTTAIYSFDIAFRTLRKVSIHMKNNLVSLFCVLNNSHLIKY